MQLEAAAFHMGVEKVIVLDCQRLQGETGTIKEWYTTIADLPSRSTDRGEIKNGEYVAGIVTFEPPGTSACD